MRGVSIKKLAAGAVCALAFVAATASAAWADGPTLRVTDLGQSSAPVEVGQPPIDVGSANGCAHPFTFANESACPTGTWPALGLPWGPIEDVAGGDVLQLAFSSPVSSVAVGSTSNYEPGLHDPDGKAIPNYDVVPESPAVATSDPAVWQVTLPPFDIRAISGQGYTFSVVAGDESGYHGYPLGIRSPRYANESTKCGHAFYSTGVEVGQCPGHESPKALPQILTIAAATYDGRVLTLDVEVPEAGKLRMGIPVTCAAAGPCHRKTTIFKQATHAGHLIVRKRLSLRLGADPRISVPARFQMPAGGLIVSILRPKVHVRLRSPRSTTAL